jgi:hypothetical protein
MSYPSALTGYPVNPPPLVGPVCFDQSWADLTFVHWPVLPDSVAHLYPPGARPDVFADGLTYVALVPFAMSRTAVGTSLRLPYFGRFQETNIRLYSIDDAGRHGVLFRSLETSRLAVVPVRKPARQAGRGGYRARTKPGRCRQRRSSTSMTNCWTPARCNPPVNPCARSSPPVYVPGSAAPSWCARPSLDHCRNQLGSKGWPG